MAELPPSTAGPRDAAAAADASVETVLETKLSVSTVLVTQARLKQQLMECQASAHSNDESDVESNFSEVHITRSVEDLQSDLEELKISVKNKTFFIQRMQLMNALRKRMTQNDEETRLIVGTMKHTIKLCQAIIKSHQQTREIEEKLNNIKKKRLEKNEHPDTFLQERNAVSGTAAFFPFLKQVESKKCLQILVARKKGELENTKLSEMMESIRKNLQTESAMTAVIQSVFQTIIVGSRVNWAEDPSLKAIVLQLEKDVDI